MIAEQEPHLDKKTDLADTDIVPVRVEDIHELADLAARGFRDTYGEVAPEEELQQAVARHRSVEYFLDAINSSTILVAKRDGSIVGYVQFGEIKDPNIVAGEGDKELARLYVDTPVHHQGIGTQLLDAALADPAMAAAPNVYLEVWDKNVNAIALYEKYGFEPVGRAEFTAGGKQHHNIVMVRRQTEG
jgi:ribosomal protein S18 acetylase RimI-like enzyme